MTRNSTTTGKGWPLARLIGPSRSLMWWTERPSGRGIRSKGSCHFLLVRVENTFNYNTDILGLCGKSPGLTRSMVTSWRPAHTTAKLSFGKSRQASLAQVGRKSRSTHFTLRPVRYQVLTVDISLIPVLQSTPSPGLLMSLALYSPAHPRMAKSPC